MSILMAGLQETQMWAIYQMGMGNEMPLSVTKEDLTFIIAFLFKQLDWVDGEFPCHTSGGSPILVDSQNSASQSQKNQLTSEPDQNDKDRLEKKGDGDTSVDIAEDGTQVDQNDEQNQSNSQVENVGIFG